MESLKSKVITLPHAKHAYARCFLFSRIMQGMLNPSLPQRKKNVKPKLKRRGRPRKRKFKRDPWEDDDELSDKDEDDEDDDDLRHYKMNGRKGGRRKWNYTFKEDEEDVFVETVIDDEEPSITEEVSDFYMFHKQSLKQ